MSRQGRALGLLLVALAAASTGCAPTLGAVTTPPPSKAADLYHPAFDDDHIHLSKGATLGLDCYDFWWGTPCQGAVITSDDPTVARVLPAYLKRAPSPWAGAGASPQRERGFVVIATGPGETTVHVRSEDGESEVDVSVE